MERKQIYRGLWLITISLLLMLLTYRSAPCRSCNPSTAGNVSNSGTVSGVGSGNIGTGVGMGDDTKGVKGPQSGSTSSQTSKSGTPSGKGDGYNPLDDPNLKG